MIFEKQAILLFIVTLVGFSSSHPVDLHESGPSDSPHWEHPEIPKHVICDTMSMEANGTEGHPGKPQDPEKFPYTISLSDNAVHKGNSISITISSKNREVPFRGFLIQGRCENQNHPEGLFTWSSLGPYVLNNCDGGRENALLYINRADQKEAYITWNATLVDCSPVHFYVSIVKTTDTFWVKHQSEQSLKVAGIDH